MYPYQVLRLSVQPELADMSASAFPSGCDCGILQRRLSIHPLVTSMVNPSNRGAPRCLGFLAFEVVFDFSLLYSSPPSASALADVSRFGCIRSAECHRRGGGLRPISWTHQPTRSEALSGQQGDWRGWGGGYLELLNPFFTSVLLAANITTDL